MSTETGPVASDGPTSVEDRDLDRRIQTAVRVLGGVTLVAAAASTRYPEAFGAIAVGGGVTTALMSDTTRRVFAWLEGKKSCAQVAAVA
jgi:hypothetical protein